MLFESLELSVSDLTKLKFINLVSNKYGPRPNKYNLSFSIRLEWNFERTIFYQGLEGYSQDPGFDSYKMRDSGKRKMS